MATTAAVSGPEARPGAVSFGQRPFSLPVSPSPALQWAFVGLVVANLGRIPILAVGSGQVAFVLNDVCVGGLVAFMIIAAVLRRSLWIDTVAAFALLFATIGFGAAIAAVSRYGLTSFELFVSLSYLARWLVYFGLYLFVINNVDASQVGGIWKSLLTIMLVFAGFGVFQSLFLPGFAQMVYPGSRDYIDWDPQGARLVSTVLDPNIAASMIVLVLLIQLSQIAMGAKVKWWQPTLFMLALAMTVSRSGLLALVAGMCTIVLARGLSVRLMRMLAVIGFLMIAIVPRIIAFAQTYGRFEVGEGTSAGTRVAAWLIALKTIAEHPVFGVGFNTYGYVKEAAGYAIRGWASYGSDGGLLFVAVMTGLVGLAVYLAMLRSVMRRCRRIWRDEEQSLEQRGLAMGIFAGIVAVCVHSLFANSIFTTFVMEVLWVTWGLTFAMERRPGASQQHA
jgi:O-antigen ligase